MRPTGRVPSLRYGQPAMLAGEALPQNSLRCCAASCRQLRPVRARSVGMLRCPRAPHPLRFSARPEGVEAQLGPSLRSAAGSAVLGAERSDGPNGFATPLRLRLRRRACGVARAPQDARASWSDSRGLFERRERSERSEFHRAPRKRCGAGLPRSEAQGSQTWGRLSLVPFFGETKKGTAPPGAHPGQREHAESATTQAQRTDPTPLPLTPTLSPEGRGSKTAHPTPLAPHPSPLPRGARVQGRRTSPVGSS